MEQEALDRLQGAERAVRRDHAAGGRDRLEGWDERIRALADAINGIHAILLRESLR